MRRLVLVGVAMLGTAGLAGCGGGSDAPAGSGAVATVPATSTPAPTPTPTPSATPVADVLLVVGQSNATGQTSDTTTGYVADAGVQAFDGARLVPYAPNQFTGVTPGGASGRWAAEIAYVAAWRRANPTARLVVLKYTAPGTQLAFSGDGTPDWNTQSRGELFDASATYVAAGMAAVRAAGFAPRVRLLWWQQGESDCYATASYGASLAALVAAWRDPAGAFALPATTPVAIGRLSSGYVAGAGCTGPIRAAQRGVTDADMGGRQALVDDDDLPLEADRIHLNNAAQMTLGGRLWAVDAGTYAEP